MKRFISLLMSALMLVAVLAGCGGRGSGGSGGEQGNDASENIVTLRNTGFLTTSDPNQTTNTHEYTVFENIYEGLYDLNEAEGGYDLRLAEKIEANDDWEGSDFRYCNEFLFKSDAPFDEDECLKFLGSMGDCELLVGAYPDYKIHVHSNTPNLVLEHMLQLGQIYEVFIHNMEMEAHDRTAKIHEDQEKAAEPAKALGFVAVAAGSGEADILKSLGVDVIVSGGQTMNPSTADLLGAVDQVNATSVIILPNNGNIREAAASACTDKKVSVVPTKTVPQAFSALFAVLPDSELEDAVAAMVDAISEVRDGEVTRAVRDSSASDGSPIHSGDVMGIIAGSIDVVGSDVKQVTLDCINRMQEEEEGDALTILAGEELSDEAFREIVDAIEEAQPDLEIDAHRGEQPLYPVIFSIE